MTIPLDVKSLRMVSDQGEFYPYKAKRAPLIRIDLLAATVTYAKTRAEKRAMLLDRTDDQVFISVWPGEWSSDVFFVDDPENFLNEVS